MNTVRLSFLSCPSNEEDEVYLEYLNPIFQVWENKHRQERCARCSCKAIIKLSDFYFLSEILSVQSIKWLVFFLFCLFVCLFLTFIFLHVTIYIMRLLFSGFCYCLSEMRWEDIKLTFAFDFLYNCSIFSLLYYTMKMKKKIRLKSHSLTTTV